jgi:hypothetical protein
VVRTLRGLWIPNFSDEPFGSPQNAGVAVMAISDKPASLIIKTAFAR